MQESSIGGACRGEVAHSIYGLSLKIEPSMYAMQKYTSINSNRLSRFTKAIADVLPTRQG